MLSLTIACPPSARAAQASASKRNERRHPFRRSRRHYPSGEHVEVESGKGSDALDRRPHLAAALAAAWTRSNPIAITVTEAASRRFYNSPRLIAPAMWSAWRSASATMVSVGFSAAPVVNWLPSETNRFLHVVRLAPFVDDAVLRLLAHPVGAEIVRRGVGRRAERLAPRRPLRRRPRPCP